MYYPVSKFFGFSFSFGDNLLEKALHVGSSDRNQFEAFKNEGGLQNVDTWKGYYVQSVSTNYDESGKLAILNIELVKSWPSKKTASINNLKGSLSSECGSNWTQSDLQIRASMHEAQRNSVECAIQDKGQSVYVNVMQR
jgi:hypothetical protein